MNTIRRFLVILALFFGVTPHAKADDAINARQHYDEGRTALEAGRYREAALHFEAAGRLREHGAARYAAALAWDKAEEPVRAADNFELALNLPGLKPEEKKQAKERLDRLERSLGTVVINGPHDLVVQFEGSMEAVPPSRLHVPPGINSLLIARGERIERRNIKLRAGEVVEIDVTAPKAAPKPAPPPAPVKPQAPTPPPAADTNNQQMRKIMGYSAIGVGAFSAAVAVTLGFKTLSARDKFEKQRTQDSYDNAKQYRTWTNVAWLGAAVLGGAGTALLFWPTDDKENGGQKRAGLSLSPTPTGIQLRGSF